MVGSTGIEPVTPTMSNVSVYRPSPSAPLKRPNQISGLLIMRSFDELINNLKLAIYLTQRCAQIVPGAGVHLLVPSDQQECSYPLESGRLAANTSPDLNVHGCRLLNFRDALIGSRRDFWV